jgi:hypothetical protein
VIVAGLVAVVVFGVGLIIHGAVRLVRRTGVTAGDAPAGDVAILLVARDRADRIGDAVAAAGRIGAPVFVVSDGSADPTAELAYERGAEVVETLRPLGPGRSVLAGVQSFRLAERYAFVLVLDVDVRLDPSYLAATLPLFGDASVAAVDARVAGSGWLGSYLARTYALTQPFGRGRVGPLATVTHAAPGVARLYRTEVLERLELDLPTPAVPNFDATLQIYRDHLGRVALSPGPPAVLLPPAPATRTEAAGGALASYREWRRAMLVGLGAAVRRRPPRRDRHGLAHGAQLGELLGTALFVVAVPVAAVVGAGLAVAGVPVAVLNPLYLLAGFLVGDYLLTIAVTRRLPVVALAFPLLRVVDAVDVLRVTVRPRVLAWGALVAVGGAAVVRVAVATTTLPVSSAELALVDAGYRTAAGHADAALPLPLAVTGAHLDIYAIIANPFDRHLDVLTGARELSVLAAAVVVGALIATAAVLRVHPLLTAAVLVAFAAPGPVVTVFGTVGPGVFAAGWLAVALAVAVHVARHLDEGWHPDLDVFGFVALLVALATVPLLAVPLAVVVVVWLWLRDFERRDPDATWRRPTAVLLLTGFVVAALWAAGLLLTPTGPVGVRSSPAPLLLALTAVAAAGLAVPRVWPAAAGTLTALGLAFVFGPDADALLPATVVGAAITGVLLLDAVLAWRPTAARGLTAAVVVPAAVAGVLVVPPVAPRVDHAALAAWVTRELGDGVTITAPTALWADLHRDLVRLGRPNAVRHGDTGPLVVTTGGRDGTVLGRFGMLAVLATDIDRTYLDPAERAAAGRQLATNSRLLASEPVRAALRAGQVDLRVMAVLAALCAEHEITLVATGNSPAERGTGLPDRTVVVAAVDGRPVTDRRSARLLLDWLQTQRPPFAPASTRSTPDGIAISWRLPDVFDKATR